MKIKPNIAYHCATRELVEQFMKEAEEQGFEVLDINLRYPSISYFNAREKQKCICWDYLEHYQKIGYEIVEYTGKETKVETAWVIQRDDGEYYKEYGEFYVRFTDILDCEKYDTKPITTLDYLERMKWKFPDDLKNLRIVKIELRVVEE